jgi:hypothetical protein
MKKLLLILSLTLTALYTQAQTTGVQIMHVTTVESIIPGGLGRSKIITTDTDGKQDEKSLENFYSMVGINFGNIKQNETEILKTLKKYLDEGWQLINVTSGVQSPAANNGQGIYMTRYMFKK